MPNEIIQSFLESFFPIASFPPLYMSSSPIRLVAQYETIIATMKLPGRILLIIFAIKYAIGILRIMSFHHVRGERSQPVIKTIGPLRGVTIFYIQPRDFMAAI